MFNAPNNAKIDVEVPGIDRSVRDDQRQPLGRCVGDAYSGCGGTPLGSNRPGSLFHAQRRLRRDHYSGRQATVSVRVAPSAIDDLEPVIEVGGDGKLFADIDTLDLCTHRNGPRGAVRRGEGVSAQGKVKDDGDVGAECRRPRAQQLDAFDPFFGSAASTERGVGDEHPQSRGDRGWLRRAIEADERAFVDAERWKLGAAPAGDERQQAASDRKNAAETCRQEERSRRGRSST